MQIQEAPTQGDSDQEIEEQQYHCRGEEQTIQNADRDGGKEDIHLRNSGLITRVWSALERHASDELPWWELKNTNDTSHKRGFQEMGVGVVAIAGGTNDLVGKDGTSGDVEEIVIDMEKLIDEYLRNDLKWCLFSCPGDSARKRRQQSIPEAGKEEGHPVSPNQVIHSGDARGRRTTPSPREDTRARQGYVQRLEGHLLVCPFEGRLAVLPDRLVQGSAPRPHKSRNWSDNDDNGFGSQISLNSSTQKNGAYTDRETGTMDQFGVVRAISKTTNGPGQSGDFVTMAYSEMRIGKIRNTGLCYPPADPEADHKETSRQRIKTRVSTSTKLPGTDRVTPPLMTPLVDNGASIEEALTNIVGSRGEQNEQMSLRMSELEIAVHVERENLWEEINCNRQEVSRSKKRLKGRRDENLAKSLSQMTREAEQRELRLRDDMEKFGIQQEQTLGTLDTNIDAMMEMRTQAIMDRLDGLLGSRSGSKNGEPNSGETSGEPRVNFSEQPNRRRTHGSTRGRGISSSYATGDNRQRGPNIRASSTGNRPTSNKRPTQDTHAAGRYDSRKWSHVNQGRSHPSDSGSTANPESISGCNDAQAGHSRD